MSFNSEILDNLNSIPGFYLKGIRYIYIWSKDL